MSEEIIGFQNQDCIFQKINFLSKNKMGERNRNVSGTICFLIST